MKKFKFKLQSVLKYRKTLEEIAKNEYAIALSNSHNCRTEIEILKNNKKESFSSYRLDNNGDTRLYFLALQNITSLDNLIAKKMILLEKLNQIALDKLKIWQKSKEQLEIIEKLKEKKFNQYKKEIELEEQKFQAENFINRLKRGKNEEERNS